MCPTLFGVGVCLVFHCFYSKSNFTKSNLFLTTVCFFLNDYHLTRKKNIKINKWYDNIWWYEKTVLKNKQTPTNGQKIFEKKMFTLFIPWENGLKTTLCFHSIPTEWLTSKRANTNRCWWGGREGGTPSPSWYKWRQPLWRSLWDDVISWLLDHLRMFRNQHGEFGGS